MGVSVRRCGRAMRRSSPNASLLRAGSFDVRPRRYRPTRARGVWRNERATSCRMLPRGPRGCAVLVDLSAAPFGPRRRARSLSAAARPQEPAGCCGVTRQGSGCPRWRQLRRVAGAQHRRMPPSCPARSRLKRTSRSCPARAAAASMLSVCYLVRLVTGEAGRRASRVPGGAGAGRLDFFCCPHRAARRAWRRAFRGSRPGRVKAVGLRLPVVV